MPRIAVVLLAGMIALWERRFFVMLIPNEHGTWVRPQKVNFYRKIVQPTQDEGVYVMSVSMYAALLESSLHATRGRCITLDG